jgi:hypothetical protein
LRRQFGREQAFELENLGDDPVFSEFSVYNPDSRRRYRVAIRGAQAGDNHCSCPDFATNDLGTCKHIEFALARIAAQADGKNALAGGFRGSFSELFLDHAGLRRIRLRLGSDFPAELQAVVRQLFVHADGWQLPPQHFADLSAFVEQVRAAGHQLRCDEDALSFVAEVRDGEIRQERLAALYPLGADSPELKTLLKTELYPYQRAGALFAVRAGRCLIGDEMGLGKTVQAIAAVEILARHFAAERVLIVCPTSLKHQWEREFARFTDRRAAVIGGLRAVRQTRYAQEEFCKITNYETLSRDLDLIQAWAPDVVIVDEAQRIKNWNTIAARALKRIDSPYAIVLTGTPLENRLEELISIVQFVDQYRLGPTWRLLDEHQQRDERGRVVGYRELHRIGQTLAPILLRRRKAEVLEQLPERVDNTLFMPMSPLQADHHEENRLTVARIVQRWRHTGFLSEKDQLRLHCSLQNMRMVCNSSFLIDHETDDGYKADELLTLLDDILADPQAKVGRLQPVAAHPRADHPPAASAWLGACPVPRRRARRQTRRAGRPLQPRCCLPPFSQYRRRRRRPQSATCRSRGGEHGSAVESRRPRTTHRSRAPPRPDARRAGDQLCRQGNHRGKHAFGAGIQAVAVRRHPRRRRKRSRAAGDAPVEVHGNGRAGLRCGGNAMPAAKSQARTSPLDATAEAGAATEADGEAEYQETAAVRPDAEEQPAAEPATRPALPAPASAAAAGAADPWAPLLAAGTQLLGELSAASQGEA